MQIAISQTIKNEVKDYFYITLGLLIYTFGWTIFLLPYQIVTGGVTGIAAVIYYGTGYLSIVVFLINAALLLAALKILGFKFMVKTIYAIIMLSVFLALAQDWMIGEMERWYRYWERDRISCHSSSAVCLQDYHSPSSSCIMVVRVERTSSLPSSTNITTSRWDVCSSLWISSSWAVHSSSSMRNQISLRLMQ